MKKVKGGKPHWVKFHKKLPEDSIIGGYEEEVLYIMRAMHETALTPGKFVPSTGKGYVEWGWHVHEKSEFEIFCGYDCIWVPSSGNKIPVGAIEAGYTEGVHEIMYIGRVMYNNHVIPGKIAPSHCVCYIAYAGQSLAIEEYEILVDPFQRNKSVNDFYVSNLHTPNSM
ncbi:uncharacterized protein LOC123655764 [Melitaea cinxia]|uniref:uncharacterized protein LOC123655764 n=1 Tax=Melitaea cinxia TaxID=113334 RepID=UPI001E270CE2|nr:uncharacterized protein LOC123655764 [Melitaea cinxia]XP_045447484.1 uncharacterized protein LOC123655764 [Melitaea cinxia]